MAQISLPQGIASISGKVGNVVFYSRNGKQYARRLDKTASDAAALSDECRTITEALSGVITSTHSLPPSTHSLPPSGPPASV